MMKRTRIAFPFCMPGLLCKFHMQFSGVLCLYYFGRRAFLRI